MGFKTKTTLLKHIFRKKLQMKKPFLRKKSKHFWRPKKRCENFSFDFKNPPKKIQSAYKKKHLLIRASGVREIPSAWKNTFILMEVHTEYLYIFQNCFLYQTSWKKFLNDIKYMIIRSMLICLTNENINFLHYSNIFLKLIIMELPHVVFFNKI